MASGGRERNRWNNGQRNISDRKGSPKYVAVSQVTCGMAAGIIFRLFLFFLIKGHTISCKSQVVGLFE